MPKVRKFRDWIFDSAKSFPKPHELFTKKSTTVLAPRAAAARKS
jgi:hypothetical protein